MFRDTRDASFTFEEAFLSGDRATARWVFAWTNDDGSRGHVRGADVIPARRADRREALVRQGLTGWRSAESLGQPPGVRAVRERAAHLAGRITPGRTDLSSLRRRLCTSGDDSDQRGELLVGRPAVHDSQQRPHVRARLSQSTAGPQQATAAPVGMQPAEATPRLPNVVNCGWGGGRGRGHSGMLPCFFGGSVARLVRSDRSALTT